MQRRSKVFGLATIELTLVLPILLLLVFTVAEFGRLLYQYNALTKTVRDASRYLDIYATPGVSDVIDISNTLRTEVDNLVYYGATTNTGNEILPGLANSTTNVSVSGQFITLSVSYNFQPIFSTIIPDFGYGGGFNLSFPLVVSYTLKAQSGGIR
ncbi:pilus assembly protein [Thalassotalea litorea]|uniref:Pilus assembly protein n=2 Tax=Thalassotalea litorea TaxID=2020715 RepID=A0A5R9IH82_9GAMM|nr:pilus assembly protein [Thalassotalea litorea]